MVIIILPFCALSYELTIINTKFEIARGYIIFIVNIKYIFLKNIEILNIIKISIIFYNLNNNK